MLISMRGIKSSIEPFFQSLPLGGTVTLKLKDKVSKNKPETEKCISNFYSLVIFDWEHHILGQKVVISCVKTTGTKLKD